MPSLAPSAVTVLRSQVEGGSVGSRYTSLQVKLTLTGQGGPGTIPASALGLTQVLEAGTFVLQNTEGVTDIVFVGSPDSTGANLLLCAAGGPSPGPLVPQTITNNVAVGVVKGLS
jgi:hypothetical protein